MIVVGTHTWMDEEGREGGPLSPSLSTTNVHSRASPTILRNGSMLRNGKHAKEWKHAEEWKHADVHGRASPSLRALSMLTSA